MRHPGCAGRGAVSAKFPQTNTPRGLVKFAREYTHTTQLSPAENSIRSLNKRHHRFRSFRFLRNRMMRFHPIGYPISRLPVIFGKCVCVCVCVENARRMLKSSVRVLRVFLHSSSQSFSIPNHTNHNHSNEKKSCWVPIPKKQN